jgi:hypothetical protein
MNAPARLGRPRVAQKPLRGFSRPSSPRARPMLPRANASRELRSRFFVLACPGAARREPEPRRRNAKSLRAVSKRRRFALREPELAEGPGAAVEPPVASCGGWGRPERAKATVVCPQRDSNPCCRLERAVSWASRRWGPGRRERMLAQQCRALSAFCPARLRPLPPVWW